MNTLLLTVAEAAEECRVSEGFLEKEIREKRLSTRKLGRLTRIERTELLRWIADLPCREFVGTTSDQGESPRGSVAGQVAEKTIGTRR